MITETSRSSPPVARLRRVHSMELRGPAGRLEAVLNDGSPEAACAAVVCHPHPLGGGSLHNKVVYHAMKAMNAPGLDWPVLRFNFRGTGRSEGEHDGAAEAGDVLAALAWVENEYKLPVVAVGFSFGAAMVLKACCGSGCGGSLQDQENGDARDRVGLAPTRVGLVPTRDLSAPTSADKKRPQIWGTQNGILRNVRAVVALGLPVRSGTDAPKYDYGHLGHCRIPKLFLSGDNDRFATKSELIEIV